MLFLTEQKTESDIFVKRVKKNVKNELMASISRKGQMCRFEPGMADKGFVWILLWCSSRPRGWVEGGHIISAARVNKQNCGYDLKGAAFPNTTVFAGCQTILASGISVLSM